MRGGRDVLKDGDMFGGLMFMRYAWVGWIGLDFIECLLLRSADSFLL